MQFTIHLSSLVILFGVATALTLSLLLWIAPWGNRTANHCLGLLLTASCVISVAQIPIIESAARLREYHLIFSLQLLPGPLLYFYTRTLTQSRLRWQRRDVWHLLPVPGMALLWYLQLPVSAESPLNLPCFSSSACDLTYRARFVHRASTYLSVIGYAIASLGLLRPHLQRIKESYSAIEEVNLRWLTTLTYAFLVIATIGIAIEVRGLFFPQGDLTPGLLQAMSPLLLSLLLGWFGLQQRRIQLGETGETEPEPVRAEAEAADKKYQTSSLTQERAEAIWQKLQQTMAGDKPYLEAGLKIAELARTLEVPVHHLSETINGFANQSFYEFINQYRVEEAARLLGDDSLQHLSVTDIGLQAGFNSNSTFFTHFKKRLQQTPRQYRQRQAQAVAQPAAGEQTA